MDEQKALVGRGYVGPPVDIGAVVLSPEQVCLITGLAIRKHIKIF